VGRAASSHSPQKHSINIIFIINPQSPVNDIKQWSWSKCDEGSFFDAFSRRSIIRPSAAAAELVIIKDFMSGFFVVSVNHELMRWDNGSPSTRVNIPTERRSIGPHITNSGGEPMRRLNAICSGILNVADMTNIGMSMFGWCVLEMESRFLMLLIASLNSGRKDSHCSTVAWASSTQMDEMYPAAAISLSSLHHLLPCFKFCGDM
jgi:hypothetical protein